MPIVSQHLDEVSNLFPVRPTHCYDDRTADVIADAPGGGPGTDGHPRESLMTLGDNDSAESVHRRIHLRRGKSPTVFARWRMASMSSRNILTIAETTRRTALIRHKTVGRHHAASVEIRPTPKTAGTKPTKQRTIWRCYGRSESLHKSLRRKFDTTSNYLEAKVQMEQVMDSAVASIW